MIADCGHDTPDGLYPWHQHELCHDCFATRLWHDAIDHAVVQGPDKLRNPGDGVSTAEIDQLMREL